jgi:hypothetical protein
MPAGVLALQRNRFRRAAGTFSVGQISHRFGGADGKFVYRSAIAAAVAAIDIG